METIIVERTIAAPAEEVFDWCAETTNWQGSLWVLRNRLKQPGSPHRWGARAIRSHLWLIGWFLERVTTDDRPHSLSYHVIKSFPPARHEGGTMTFTETPTGTRVTWTTTVEVKIPLVGGPVTRLFKPLLVLVFGQILQTCGKEMQHRQRTGNAT